MGQMLYEVTATFRDEGSARGWVAWMLNSHIADVIKAGASRGRLLRFDDTPLTFSAQYEFASRAEFREYLEQHALRLRAEGLARFGADRVEYSRRTAEVVVESHVAEFKP